MKIVFIGTPEFGEIVLEGLVKSGYKPTLVITETDKPSGRKNIITPPPTKILAERYKIPVLQSEKILNFKSEILNLKPDLGIVAAFGQIISQEILNIPKYGFLNVHPSLLPKYRGPSPVQYAILNGDEETGVTIMLVNEKMDQGPIISIEKLKMKNEKLTYEELHNKLAQMGAELLIETIPDWVNGKIKPLPQAEALATYTKIIKTQDGKIDWKKPVDEIERQVRAFDPWPGSFTFWQKNDKLVRIKILQAEVLKQTNNGHFGVPGKIFMAENNEIAVQTGKDFLIIKKLQLEGKRKITSAEFLKGHPDFIGTILR